MLMHCKPSFPIGSSSGASIPWTAGRGSRAGPPASMHAAAGPPSHLAYMQPQQLAYQYAPYGQAQMAYTAQTAQQIGGTAAAGSGTGSGGPSAMVMMPAGPPPQGVAMAGMPMGYATSPGAAMQHRAAVMIAPSAAASGMALPAHMSRLGSATSGAPNGTQWVPYIQQASGMQWAGMAPGKGWDGQLLGRAEY